jgi:hypothetical protein
MSPFVRIWCGCIHSWRAFVTSISLPTPFQPHVCLVCNDIWQMLSHLLRQLIMSPFGSFVWVHIHFLTRLSHLHIFAYTFPATRAVCVYASSVTTHGTCCHTDCDNYESILYFVWVHIHFSTRLSCLHLSSRTFSPPYICWRAFLAPIPCPFLGFICGHTYSLRACLASSEAPACVCRVFVSPRIVIACCVRVCMLSATATHAHHPPPPPHRRLLFMAAATTIV